MSVEMKLGIWQARGGDVFKVSIHDPDCRFEWRSEDGMCWMGNGDYWDNGKPSQFDLIRHLGPIELSPSPASAEAGPAGASNVSTEDPQEQLKRMRDRYNAMDREASIYSGLLAALDQARSDLDEAIKRLEREVEG